MDSTDIPTSESDEVGYATPSDHRLAFEDENARPGLSEDDFTSKHSTGVESHLSVEQFQRPNQFITNS